MMLPLWIANIVCSIKGHDCDYMSESEADRLGLAGGFMRPYTCRRCGLKFEGIRWPRMPDVPPRPLPAPPAPPVLREAGYVAPCGCIVFNLCDAHREVYGTAANHIIQEGDTC